VGAAPAAEIEAAARVGTAAGAGRANSHSPH